ncbi:CcoQ/FixQ family Cbb3-type cytochrome c oxidase assembly chaperone [Flavisolibacter sp. BT320]|nr:CcoQ/FixQ family Cbb3-type cytochrome c oxidase assembly chaperone [Flavisolibacter longurius]
MLKYIKNYAASIKDIDIYPVFSLLVFVLFFAAMLYLVKRMDKQRAEDLRHMPLDLEPETTNTLNTVKQA